VGKESLLGFKRGQLWGDETGKEKKVLDVNVLAVF
jgi:hypothetical protein